MASQWLGMRSSQDYSTITQGLAVAAFGVHEDVQPQLDSCFEECGAASHTSSLSTHRMAFVVFKHHWVARQTSCHGHDETECDQRVTGAHTNKPVIPGNRWLAFSDPAPAVVEPGSRPRWTSELISG